MADFASSGGATGLVGSGLVAYGVVSALSTYQSVYSTDPPTIAHQQFRLIETCMWLLVAVFGACLLIIAHARSWRQDRWVERMASEPLGLARERPMPAEPAPLHEPKPQGRVKRRKPGDPFFPPKDPPPNQPVRWGSGRRGEGR